MGAWAFEAPVGRVGVYGDPYYLKGSQVASELLRLKPEPTKAYTMFIPKFEKHPLFVDLERIKTPPFQLKSMILKINMMKYPFCESEHGVRFGGAVLTEVCSSRNGKNAFISPLITIRCTALSLSR